MRSRGGLTYRLRIILVFDRNNFSRIFIHVNRTTSSTQSSTQADFSNLINGTARCKALFFTVSGQPPSLLASLCCTLSSMLKSPFFFLLISPQYVLQEYQADKDKNVLFVSTMGTYRAIAIFEGFSLHLLDSP